MTLMIKINGIYLHPKSYIRTQIANITKVLSGLENLVK